MSVVSLVPEIIAGGADGITFELDNVHDISAAEGSADLVVLSYTSEDGMRHTFPCISAVIEDKEKALSLLGGEVRVYVHCYMVDGQDFPNFNVTNVVQKEQAADTGATQDSSQS